MRLLALFLRSRQVGSAFVAAAMGTAALWGVYAALDAPTADRPLAAFAVVLGVAVAGQGLAGPDANLDKTAAVAWVPWRTVHVVAIASVTAGLVLATGVAGEQLGPVAHVVRVAVGTGGLLALAAATIGAGTAWAVPVTWVLTAATLLTIAFTDLARPVWVQVLTWPMQPLESHAATVAAAVFGVMGTAVHAARGPRP